MADKKISELTTAASLSGAEVAPIVQSGATYKTTTGEVANLGYKSVITDAATAKTLALADRYSWLRLGNSSPITLTVPTTAAVAFRVGERIEGVQAGSGKITFTPSPGVTINVSSGFKLVTRAQGAWYRLVKIDSATWDLTGDLEPV